VTSARRRVIRLALAVVAGMVVFVLWVTEIISSAVEKLVVQFARALGIAALPQSFFEELDQPVDQPLLPADDMEAALMAVLLQNFTDTALQIGHCHTS
jgi:hypothetical protein